MKYLLAAGIAIAYVRYATPVALANAPARLRVESERMPAPLVKLFYFDDIIDWLFVKPSLALGRFFGRWFDPEFLDGAVRSVAAISGELGEVVRYFQNGLLRSYVLVVVFGAACFAIYYAVQGVVR